MTRDEYVDLLKSTFIRAGVKMVVSHLVSKFAFFSLSIPNFFLSLVVEKILTVAVKYTELGAFFLYIDLRTSEQGRLFEQSAIKNKTAQLEGNHLEKIMAEKELIASFKSLAKLTN